MVFIQNSVSEKKMAAYTVEFMETIQNQIPEKILEGDTIGVLRSFGVSQFKQ